jgi:hypothetical protein
MALDTRENAVATCGTLDVVSDIAHRYQLSSLQR